MPTIKTDSSRLKQFVVCGILAALAGLTVPAGLQATDKPYTQGFFPVPSNEAAQWRSDMGLATEAWQVGKFKKARQHFEDALHKGNIGAAWFIGFLYERGRGVKRDQVKALEYYDKVADGYSRGIYRLRRKDQHIFADALVRVADAHRDGFPEASIAANPHHAFKLYNVAANYEHPGADHGRGIIYLRGLGVKKNIDRALLWFGAAARKHYAPSLAVLGDLYWSGVGVTKNRIHGLGWYLLATEAANPATHQHFFNRLKEMLDELSPEDEAVARALAQRWRDSNPAPNSILPVAD